jgi:glycosyltransferase involved in cell wall biosynthesis
MENTGIAAHPMVLCVGSLEGRKNHASLLEAACRLWDAGRQFELHVVGWVHPETGRSVLARINEVRAAGRPVIYHGCAPDSVLAALYRGCAFTVYPSLSEGFGLPVEESLRFGKPCVVGPCPALAERARSGGCLVLRSGKPEDIADAVGGLLGDPGLLASLANGARSRLFRNWGDYARDLVEWAGQVPIRKDRLTPRARS